MADVLHFADRIILPYQPRAVVIYEGDNDTGRFNVPPATIASELKQIISQIHTELPDTRVYVMSVKPSLAREVVWDKAQETNQLYQTLAASDERLRYIDVATPFLRADGKVMDDIFIDDGLHLNDKGTAIWAATIKAALMAGGRLLRRNQRLAAQKRGAELLSACPRSGKDSQPFSCFLVTADLFLGMLRIRAP